MANYGEIQQRIADRLIDPNSTAVGLSAIKTAINKAVEFWKFKRFWFNDRKATIVMDPDDPFILLYGETRASFPLAPNLPSNFLVELEKSGFVIEYNNLSYTMQKVYPPEFDNENSRGTGLPFIYTFRNRGYEFYLYPNIDYEMSVYYLRDYDSLVDDSDTNDFTDYADDLIMYEALSRLTIDLRQDIKMSQSFKSEAEREYQNLKTRSFDQIKTGTLVTSNIL